MSAPQSTFNRICALGAAALLAGSLPAAALAQYQQTPAPSTQRPGPRSDQDAQAEGEAPKAEYSKEFRKKAGPVQEAVNEKKWTEVLEMLPELEAIESPTRDDLKAIATWRLQATQGVGDQEAFAAAIEKFLAEGFAEPENAGALHRQLAAHYSNKGDREKTLLHFQKFVDATPDVQPDELETLGRLHLQANHFAEASQYLGKAIELAKSRNEKPKEIWFQLRDRCFVELKDEAGRLANLEELVRHYPDKDYYSRIVAIYQQQSRDDRVVMLNAYRLAVSDPQGGLATVGGYLSYADTALNAGSPGEAVRALERGMKEGIVPQAGTNQQTLNEAKNAVTQDKKALSAEAAAAAGNNTGEEDVKLGLGFYSTGDFAKAVEVTRRGIQKGGVARLDDANLLLGAALLELGRPDEARAAFEAAAQAATAGSPMKRIADLWIARVSRTAMPAATPAGTPPGSPDEAPVQPAPTAG